MTVSTSEQLEREPRWVLEWRWNGWTIKEVECAWHYDLGDTVLLKLSDELEQVSTSEQAAPEQPDAEAVERLTEAEFQALPTYTCSMPTQPPVGFRFKTNYSGEGSPRKASMTAERWWLGDVFADSEPGYVETCFTRILPVVAEQVSAPAEPTEARKIIENAHRRITEVMAVAASEGSVTPDDRRAIDALWILLSDAALSESPVPAGPTDDDLTELIAKWQNAPSPTLSAPPVPVERPFADRPENECPRCGTGAHVVVRRDVPAFGEGEVRCTGCDAKIRDWDAG